MHRTKIRGTILFDHEIQEEMAMAITGLSRFTLGDMLLIFEIEEETREVGFYMVPAAMEARDVSRQKHYRINNIAQLKIVGDKYPTFYGHGVTMRNSETTGRFTYCSQSQERIGGATRIRTTLRDPRGYLFYNDIIYYDGTMSIEMSNTFVNASDQPVTLEMMASFELGNLTPFVEGMAPETLLLHRLRSKWSQEGRLVTERIEDLQLEPSWSNCAVGVERFGTVGSMPVRKYFPFVAVEDTVSSALWGAQLRHEASWQMEAYRQDDGLHLSGGLADRECGQWTKCIRPQQSFTTPTAVLSVCQGDLDLLCHRLTSAGERFVDADPACEQELPIIFNEYCTTWGNPSHENIAQIVDAIRGKGISYFVIDCGWFKEDGVPWDISMGDYNVSSTLFPQGLGATVQLIRNAGMQAGIWFEIDNIGRAAQAYEQQTAHMLKRDGQPLTTGSRRFWDMNDPWVQDYLEQKVIGTLQQYGFSYMKMDYNDTIGVGCDGTESPGEALRQNMEASLDFVRRVREQVPGIILENCASGGHKLEPLMMSLCAMASFSDAHETEEIPIIALNLHRAILPRQSQIWAVIRQTDSLKRIGYSIANTFLGRMCLSGDVTDLSAAQWDVIDRGIAYYKEIAPIIRHGISHRYGPKIISDRYPRGWQALKRVGGEKGVVCDTDADDSDHGLIGDLADRYGREALIVIHVFHGDHGELSERIEIPLDDCGQTIAGCYSYDRRADIRVQDGKLIYRPKEEMTAVSVHLV